MAAREQDDLIELYRQIKDEIQSRVREFQGFLKSADDRRIFKELVFCLFTPQSKAKACWEAVEFLDRNNLLWNANALEIAQGIRPVRFRFNKSRYLILARQRFLSPEFSWKKYLTGSPKQIRINLVKDVKGLGLKEASHFLRNIGIGLELAILDRHILKNLHRFGVIKGVPNSLTKSIYLEIEDKMMAFSEKTGIPMADLDLLFWYKQAGEVFK